MPPEMPPTLLPKKNATKMPMQMNRMVTAVDWKPVAIPEMMLVAVPVSDYFAIFLTELYSSEV